MAKCSKCSKLVTKKSPGLQCSRCNKWMHATCASLSTEQITALYNTDAVDWKCRACNNNTNKKRISVILPEIEDDENTDSESITQGIGLDNGSQKILATVLTTIRREIRDTIQEEIKRTLQFYSDKIDDFQTKIDLYEEKIKTIENQYKNLNNKYTNYKNNMDSVQIKLNILEQERLENIIEICGIQYEKQEKTAEIVNKITNYIKQDYKDITKIHKKENKSPASQKRNSSIVVLTLREGRKEQWLEAAKAVTITPREIGLDGGGRIYLREALTPTTAYLLWKAKTELKNTNLVKYVWCKRGNILIKKCDNEKTFSIKSESDIEKWVLAFKK